jgi:hypothetical protein
MEKLIFKISFYHNIRILLGYNKFILIILTEFP